jgi:hypothetical protein
MCNLMLPSFFSDIPHHMGLRWHLKFVAVGGLVAEPCLLGIWCSLSRQAIKYRITATVVLLLMVVYVFCVGLNLAAPDSSQRGMPLESALMIVSAALGMFAFVQVPLWFLRREKRLQIVSSNSPELASDRQRSQFGVGYLILWTVIMSVFLSLLRSTFPAARYTPPLFMLLAVVLFSATFIGLSSLLSIPCVWIVLTERPSPIPSLLLLGTIVSGPFLMLVCLNKAIVGSDSLEVVYGVLYYEYGLTGTTLAMLFVLRLLGYRMLVMNRFGVR